MDRNSFSHREMLRAAAVSGAAGAIKGIMLLENVLFLSVRRKDFSLMKRWNFLRCCAGDSATVTRLWAAICFAIFSLLILPAAYGQDLRVSLLGTGFVQPAMDRFGPSTLVEAGGEKLLFDCGRGCLQRLTQLGVPLKDVNKLFITHFHSDHLVGIDDLWLTGWIRGRTDVPLEVWGPPGTRAMMENLVKAFDLDIQIRRTAGNSEGIKVTVHEIKEGVVYERGGVKVTAFDIAHGNIKPALGFRVDYRGRSVAMSGDTAVSENLIRFSRGVDLLIHEVSAAPQTGIAMHVTPEEAGQVFDRVKPKLAVYSHIILPPNLTPSELIARTRQTYKGPLEVGEDLMVINIGETINIQPRSKE